MTKETKEIVVKAITQQLASAKEDMLRMQLQSRGYTAEYLKTSKFGNKTIQEWLDSDAHRVALLEAAIKEVLVMKETA